MKSIGRQTGNRWLAFAISIIIAAAAVGCSKNEQAARQEPAGAFETMRAHIDAWLSTAANDSLLISSAALKNGIVDDWDNQGGRYRIVSARKPADYEEAGHIPHSINIDWRKLTSDETLARLDPGKKLIIYCYYGNASMISCTILNLLGYDCTSLDFGMMDWNLYALVKDPWDGTGDYAVETTDRRVTETYAAPVVTSEEADAAALIKQAAGSYLGGNGSPIIAAADVKAIVDGWEETGVEYQIVDVRPAGEYGGGHVPYAFNIPLAEIVRPASLAKLDPARTVIVCSENGQTGQMAATALNLLGYRAVNMLFGMMDWNAAHVDSAHLWDGAADYPIELEE